jgi:CHASE domain
MDVQNPAPANDRSESVSNPPLIALLTLLSTLALTAFIWQIFKKEIKPAALSQHIKQIRGEDFSEYTVRPPGSRPEYNSIIYIEPFNTLYQRAFGLDMLTEPLRRAAMLKARDNGSHQRIFDTVLNDMLFNQS